MSQFTLDLQPEDPAPKRGDLLYSKAVDVRGSRTYIVLSSRLVRRRDPDEKHRRFKLTMVRWWEIRPQFRQLLHRLAERDGGQQVFFFERYPPKKRVTFEQYMGRL